MFLYLVPSLSFLPSLSWLGGPVWPFLPKQHVMIPSAGPTICKLG